MSEDHIFVRAARLGIRPIDHAFNTAQLIAAGWDRPDDPILYFLPPAAWRLLADDMEREAAEAWQRQYPERTPPRMLPENFRRLNVLTTQFALAPSDDQDAIDAANEEQAQRCHFAYYRDTLISGAPRLNRPKIEADAPNPEVDETL